MAGAERFKPYSRGISKQEIIAYLEASDTVFTPRGHLPKRALQMEAANRQRRLENPMLSSNAVLATHTPGPSLPQQASAVQYAPQPSINHASQPGGINSALFQAIEYHGQHSDNLSSSSGTSLSDPESSDKESSESFDQESSPDPFELNGPIHSTDQISFGDTELIDLGSHGTSAAPAVVVDSTQQNLYLSVFEGIDVFAPAPVAFDPPTPILAPDTSSNAEEVANPNDEDLNFGERAQSSNTSQRQSQVVERLDRLIALQNQVLCVNLLAFGMLFHACSKDSNAPTIPFPEK